MAAAAWELQVAIIAALEADSALATALGGTAMVYDAPTPNLAMPYVTYDGSQDSEWDTGAYPESDGIGIEHMVQISTWSAYEGKKQTEAIMDAVRDRLHNASLTLTAHRLINLRFQFSDRLRDADGQAMHGVLRFRAVTEEI